MSSALTVVNHLTGAAGVFPPTSIIASQRIHRRKQTLGADQVCALSDLPQAGSEVDSTSGARDVFGARDVEGRQLPTTLEAQVARLWLF